MQSPSPSALVFSTTFAVPAPKRHLRLIPREILDLTHFARLLPPEIEDLTHVARLLPPEIEDLTHLAIGCPPALPLGARSSTRDAAHALRFVHIVEALRSMGPAPTPVASH
jgi:hypothetical protein